MQTIQLNELVNVSEGDETDFEFQAPKSGKYIVETTGSPSVSGIFGPWPKNADMQPGTGNGKVRISPGAGKWAETTLPQGRYLYHVVSCQGECTFKVRRRTFIDIFKMKLKGQPRQ